MNIGTRIKNAFAGMWEDTRAVSPIVATLVLVVVAITGAAGVGTIMGTFSSDVSDQSSSAGVTDAAGTDLLITGSTTVQPVSELLAEAYMVTHPGIKVTVQGGGSGMGVTAVGMNIADLGAASRDVDPEKELDKYPYLQEHEIGGSAVVVILNGMEGNMSDATLKTIFSSSSGTVNLTAGTPITIGGTDEYTVYQRGEKSGTEDVFSDYLFGTKTAIDDKTNIEGATGNAGVLSAVAGNSKSIGFVDFGFAWENENVNITGVGGYGNASITSDNIEAELSGEGNTHYPDGLTRPLNYITNGPPSSIEQDFISFARNKDSIPYFEECGYFSLLDIA